MDTAGELMRQAERILTDGLHPRQLVEGIELAREEALSFLEKFKRPIEGKSEGTPAHQDEEGQPLLSLSLPLRL